MLDNTLWSFTNVFTECQQTSPRPYSCYAAAPNDIWALGVILVNLTCGRNPWKKASLEDSTFNAFLRDQEFLKTILPLTNEFHYVLRRIFECNPAKRINISELRDLIYRCPAFTTRSAAPLPSPPTTPADYSRELACEQQYSQPQPFSLSPQVVAPPQIIAPAHVYAAPAFTPASSGTLHPSRSSINLSPHQQPTTTLTAPPQIISTCHYSSTIPHTWYANFIPALNLAQKNMSFQPFLSGVRIF